jgi:oxygen-independent coproporphyrinogen-3 oxidase
MGLRLTDGIELSVYESRTGTALMDAIDQDILRAAVDEGYLTVSPTHLVATAEGRKRLDALLPALAK